jgi:hypothetical protein
MGGSATNEIIFVTSIKSKKMCTILNKIARNNSEQNNMYHMT